MRPDCQITGAWENDAGTRVQLRSGGEIALTHKSFDDLLAPEVCSIVAIGDVYARRGQLAIAALQSGKHVISDKPICTELAELAEIETLATERGLSVGCQLDLIESGSIRQLRALVKEGGLGRVCTITIAAQHSLRLGSRLPWYFEPNAHGGTINDIGVHVFHLLPWLTGSPWKDLISAREWNAKAEGVPHFKDSAQFHGLLENGASCFADVSYLAPDKLGYELPNYWRITVHGTRGMAETSYAASEVLFVSDEDTAPRREAALTDSPRNYLGDFIDEIEGRASGDGLTTERILLASRLALEAQSQAGRQS